MPKSQRVGKSFFISIDMLHLKKIGFVFSLFFLMLGLMSATAPTNQPAKTAAQAEEMQKAIEQGKLKDYVEKEKGGKLTLKERIALKIFNKKIKTISKHENKSSAKGEKSQTTAFLMAFLPVFLGLIFLSIHRFYLGYTGIAIAQILTFGGCGIWWLIDVIRIATGDLTPKNGDYDKKW